MEDYVPSDDILAIVESGGFKFSTDGKRGFVGIGEAVLFKKGVLYHREITEPAVIHLFRYRSEAPIFITSKIVFKEKERIMSTLALLRRVDTGVFKNDFDYRYRLFLDIVTQYELENGCEPTDDPDPVDLVIMEITNSSCNKMHLSEMSAKTGLSYIHFSRRFKQKTGMTPSDYVAALKLQKAKHLLSETDLLIREIATLCGFENEYYFSNFFKKQASISPSKYRSLAKES